MRSFRRCKFSFAAAGVAGSVVLSAAGIPSLHASVTRHDLSTVEVLPPRNAELPLNLQLEGEDGGKKALKSWLGNRPTVWTLADYTCETLCGPLISIVSDALARSGLRPGTDFRLIVVGLDPKDTAGDAANMKQAQDGLREASASYFLRGDNDAIKTLTTALGFRSVYDADHDQFAHPAAAFVITPEGRVSQVLSGLGLDPPTLRLAIVSAGNGMVGTWTDHIRLLCYGYDPASGTYNVAIGRMLAASAGATVALLFIFISLLLRREYVARHPNGRHFVTHSRTPTTE